MIKDCFWTQKYKGHFITGHTIFTRDKKIEEIKVQFRQDSSIDHYINIPVKSVHAGKLAITKLLKDIK